MILFKAPYSCEMNPIENFFGTWKIRAENCIREYSGIGNFFKDLSSSLKRITSMEIASTIVNVDMKILYKVNRKEN